VGLTQGIFKMLRSIVADSIQYDGHNVEMVVAATGKRLVISQANVKARNGLVVFIDDWLFKKIFQKPTRQGGKIASRFNSERKNLVNSKGEL